MFGINDFPMNQNNTGNKKQTPTEKVPDKEHGGKHHKVSPVIDAAIDATFVFHNKRLEGTIE